MFTFGFLVAGLITGALSAAAGASWKENYDCGALGWNGARFDAAAIALFVILTLFFAFLAGHSLRG